MKLKYLHTMVRVKDLKESMGFYALLGQKKPVVMKVKQGVSL